MNNILTQQDSVILFKLSNPISGMESLIGYTEGIIGETNDVYFDRSFRYTTDTINWSEWIDLSNTNIQDISIENNYDFDIEFRYVRKGPSGDPLEWCWTNLETRKAEKACGSAFSNSVLSFFYDCCCDEDTLLWCTNVLRKMYDQGTLPKAMSRGSNQNEQQEDRDFIDFWRSITCYFAMFVGYARKFESFQQNELLLRKYLDSKGVYLKSDQSIEDMQIIMSTFYKQINSRSTINIVRSREGIQGELLRLISYKERRDEFLFNVTDDKSNGWTMNVHSPLYKGIEQQPNLTKQFYIPKNYREASDHFPLINPQACDIVTIGGENILEIVRVQGQKSGISLDTILTNQQRLFEEGLFEEGLFDQSNRDQSIVDEFKSIVDPKLDYEIDFLVKANTKSAKITVGGIGFDLADNRIDPETLDLYTSGRFSLTKMTLPKINEWYRVRTIIYGSQQPFIQSDDILRTSMNIGDNLKLNDSTISFCPEVVLDDTNSDIASDTILSIKDFKFKPLKTDYGKSFIGGSALVEMWSKNNSLQFSDNEINTSIGLDLIPYKTGLVNNFL